jgi:CSLREA domain-containing protein
MKIKLILSIGFVIVVLLSLMMPTLSANASTFTVTSTSDESDGSCSDGDCSLRDAIILANANPGADTIQFNIPATDPSCMGGVCTIYPTSGQLPPLTGGGTIIDGYTQPGAAPASTFTPATINIVIDGINLTVCPSNNLVCNGMIITSSNNTIQGLALQRFQQNAITIAALVSPAISNNTIAGNYIGVSTMGTSAPGNGWDGVFIGGYAENNVVGGDEPAERNIISGNNLGVDIYSAYASGNRVVGNYIGSDDLGSSPLPNSLDGVRIYGGAHDNIIGGEIISEGNVIMGNGRSGVRITGVETEENTIMGNFIGTNRTGSLARSNGSEGVYLGLGTHDNTVGGDATGKGNLISGNIDSGIILTGSNTMSNTISGNVIGLNLMGTAMLGNSGSGIYISAGATNNTIGGDTQAERNYIGGNYIGVTLYGSSVTGNTIIGNYIGTNGSGVGAMPNTYAGIAIMSGAHHNRVGGSGGERNLISGNTGFGVAITDDGSDGNLVTNNYIGVTVDGDNALGNGATGVLIEEADENRIGGDTPYDWNLISGNSGIGVEIRAGEDNIVSGNIIGLAENLEDVLANGSHGVALSGGAQGNWIGGESSPDYPCNFINGNYGDGVNIQGLLTEQNVVAGNMIGDLGQANLGVGVAIIKGAKNNTIGGSWEQRNAIRNNNQYGIAIVGEGCDDNLISYNGIHDNFLTGLMISEGENNWIGPENSIIGNGADGVWIGGLTTIGNIVTENSIYSNNGSGISLIDGANGGISTPQITTQEPTYLTGNACAGCTVEVFASNDTEGEGWMYITRDTADASGFFHIPFVGAPYPHLTVTATDATNGTSEFSAVFTTIYQYLYLPLMHK